MDTCEATQIVFARVQALEPENVSKIMGYFLLQDHSDEKMLDLAFGSDLYLQSAILKAKRDLRLAFHDHFQTSPFSLPPQDEDRSNFALQLHDEPLNPGRVPSQALNPLAPFGIGPSALDRFCPSPVYSPGSWSFVNGLSNDPLMLNSNVQNRFASQHERSPRLSCLPDIYNSSCDLQCSPNGAVSHDSFYDSSPFIDSIKGNANRLNTRNSFDGSSSPDMSPLPSWKPCLYFARGYCKHGSSCRFLHGCNREGSPSSSASWDLAGAEQLPPGSLERLELELQELLRSRRAPISIASLPQLYYERFGKTLQAEGYLTESQRHGKAGYSLTKLLARLKNTLTLIDRPHGQHAVVLAEDAQHFSMYKGDPEDLSDINPSSRQIYLTFPAESTFSEDDVSAHFSAYGPVQDVRIPCQQKRMFGFVTFQHPDTVRIILSEGNPHFICGARVLVKPYREKSKPHERKPIEKGYDEVPSYLNKDICQDAINETQGFRRQMNEDVLELEKQIAGLRVMDPHVKRQTSALATSKFQGEHQSFVNPYFLDAVGLPDAQNYGFNGCYREGLSKCRMNNTLGYPMDALDNIVGEEDESPSSYTASYGTSQNSNGHNLPESPFSSPHNQVKQKMNDFSASYDGLSMNCNNVLDNELTCCICHGCFVEPIQLDCNHMFCVQCILKVIRSSKDECPVCCQHIGSQIYKLLQNRDLQSWLLPVRNSKVVQKIW